MLVWNGHAVFLGVGAKAQGSGASYFDNSRRGLRLRGGGLLAPESKHGRGALAEGADRLPARGKKK